ncbi:MAG TPA: tetratricopeptide repeat protein [Ferruginibacter sp.]|jgi:tetratricopeptide (TPR) repeat protein|nr:tetratricopeptide repeat protein [Ferruginibacter sp.]
MRRLLLPFFIIAVFFVTSCNGNDTNDDTAQPTAVNVQQQLKDLVKKYPDSILLRETLIQNYRDSGNYDAAIAEAKNTIAKDTTNGALWDHLFWLYYEDQDTANAIKSLEKATSLTSDPQYYITLGSVYAQAKNENALIVADKLYAYPTADYKKESLFIRGLYYSSIGERDKAIPFFDQSLEIDYTYFDAYREESICLYNMGRYEDAIKKLQKAVSIKSDFSVAYYWMGRCYEKLNNKKDAISAYQLALQTDPDYDDAKDALNKLQ